MRSLEERAKAVGLTMDEVKAACCPLVKSDYGVEDATMTWNEYWGAKGVEPFGDPGGNEPLWMGQAYHFVRFCEMQRQLDRLQPWKNGLV